MNYQEKKIVVKIDRVLYPKNIVAADVKNVPTFYILKTNLGTAKGRLSNLPQTNETYTLEGKWEVSTYNGSMEFIFFHASMYLPQDERSMLRYACEMTKGVGLAMENAIWDAKHDDWRKIGLSDKIKGLTPAILARFEDTIRTIENQKDRTTAVAWLLSIGCTIRMAESAYDKWGKNTIKRVKEDCYSLADLPNFSFKDVDEHIRTYFGIGQNDERRIRAAIIYYVKQLTLSNTVCSWMELFTAVSKAIDASPESISSVCSTLFANGTLHPFRASGLISLNKDFLAESMILSFARREATFTGLKARQNRSGFKFDESQLGAIQFALDHNFCVINGGAGAGKTSLIKSIADTLTERGISVELCAFAGKAAARLKEATGHDAGTIHRMLEYRGDFGFSRHTLKGITVIVDEASMVASDLMAEIVKRNPERLVLVGDEAQLPPVGSGQPFHDIVHLFPEKVRTLTTCYRNAEAIFEAALKIRRGVAPELGKKSENELWDVEDIRDLRVTHNRVIEAVRSGEVDFDEDIILCCRNGESDGETECSVVSMNRDIKSLVNPNDDGTDRIKPGDRVINTKNHADLDVWNGTTGKCDRFDSDGAMWVELDYRNCHKEDFVLIPKKQVREWQLAYALTVHKSQGSQYRKVFFVCTRRDIMALLDRPMLYTAVTRAKKECHILGDTAAFYKAINQTENKLTVMQELYKEGSAK